MSDKFDVLFPASGWNGAITSIVTIDQDLQPNRMLDIDRDWTVNAEWYIDGSFLSAINGTWEVKFFVESVGTKNIGGYEGEVASCSLNFLTDKQASSTSTRYIWKTQALRIDRGKINQEGVYMLTTLITFRDVAGHPMPMAGFTDYPLITFYKQA
jgi:hypothetical protein